MVGDELFDESQYFHYSLPALRHRLAGLPIGERIGNYVDGFVKVVVPTRLVRRSQNFGLSDIERVTDREVVTGEGKPVSVEAVLPAVVAELEPLHVFVFSIFEFEEGAYRGAPVEQSRVDAGGSRSASTQDDLVLVGVGEYVDPVQRFCSPVLLSNVIHHVFEETADFSSWLSALGSRREVGASVARFRVMAADWEATLGLSRAPVLLGDERSGRVVESALQVHDGVAEDQSDNGRNRFNVKGVFDIDGARCAVGLRVTFDEYRIVVLESDEFALEVGNVLVCAS